MKPNEVGPKFLKGAIYFFNVQLNLFSSNGFTSKPRWIPFLDSLRCTVTQIAASQSSLLWNVQHAAVQTSSVRRTFEDMSHRNATVVSHLRVSPARFSAFVCERTHGPGTREVFVQAFDGSSTTATVQRWADMVLFLSFARDSAALHSGFRTSEYLQEMQGNMLWTTSGAACLCAHFHALLSWTNRIQGKKRRRKAGSENDPVLWDPPLCGTNRTLLHQIRYNSSWKHIFKEKYLLSGVKAGKKKKIWNRFSCYDRLLVQFTNVTNKRVSLLKPTYWLSPSIVLEC